MPTSITSNPDSTKPFINSAFKEGELKRPSQATEIFFLPDFFKKDANDFAT